ncbi:hypothetical protein [Escherichia coli]|uniref:hypothetical protein n=1 Tax=Escherichia coli TaxID=562 RepID=UPI00202FB8C5|nr:hypothetical protein [Escherichia coli]
MSKYLYDAKTNMFYPFTLKHSPRNIAFNFLMELKMMKPVFDKNGPTSVEGDMLFLL